jgi:subtilisin family serine protease
MIRKSLVATATLLALGLTSSAFAGGRPDLVRADLQRGVQYTSGQLIVQYKGFATDKDKARVQALIQGSRMMFLGKRGSRFNGDLELLKVPTSGTMQARIDAVSKDPAVDFAEPNWILQHDSATNDPAYVNGQLWGMYGASTSPANQYGSGAGAISSNDCSSVWVGVIDGGYLWNHEDLAANIAKNPGDSTFDGIDNDNNGYIDDVYGWDFVNNDNTIFDNINADSHGTHVAGTIGGVGNNGIGVVGVCHKVKLMNAKFLGAQGGTTANAVLAVDYFTKLKTAQSLNLVATNNSWGGGGFSQSLYDAIERAKAADILFIAAAGNDGTNNDTSPHYPSSYANSNIIAVAAINSSGGRVYSYGATSVDICAPGVTVLSTVPVAMGKGRNFAIGSGYANYNGTSMATPHVTGAAAVYKAHNPSATGAQIKAAIMGSATATPSCNGKVVSNGRLNASGF